MTVDQPMMTSWVWAEQPGVAADLIPHLAGRVTVLERQIKGLTSAIEGHNDRLNRLEEGMRGFRRTMTEKLNNFMLEMVSRIERSEQSQRLQTLEKKNTEALKQLQNARRRDFRSPQNPLPSAKF